MLGPISGSDASSISGSDASSISGSDASSTPTASDTQSGQCQLTERIVIARIESAIAIVGMANRFNDTGKLDATLVTEATEYLRSHFGKTR